MVGMTITTLRRLVNLKRKADRFAASLPRSVSAAFFDNDLSSSYCEMVEVLIGEFLEGRQAHYVEWVLYDWQPEKNVIIVDDVQFNFKTEEEFYKFLVEHEGWQE